MPENCRPGVGSYKYDHQREEQPQQVYVDRTDAFVTFVVGLQNGFDTKHISLRIPSIVTIDHSNEAAE